MAAPIPPLLLLRGMGKTYVTPVLADVDLDLAAGEVLALTGENGAGKSTLSKLIAGLVSPTHGEMQLNGQAYAPASRTAAEALGVRMVMQELSLIPTLTVAENLLLERLPHRAGLIRRKELHALAERQMAAIGLTDIRPDTLNLDESLVEAAITPRTKAICVVHYAGVGCAMDPLLEISRRRGSGTSTIGRMAMRGI